MKKYIVDMTKDVSVKYYFIRNQETLEIARFPSKYLTHKTKSMVSPNTIRRCAFY